MWPTSYQTADGVKGDLEQAKYWYSKAAEQGMESAAKALRRLQEIKN